MKIEEIPNTTLDETDGAGDATEETVCARSVKKAKVKKIIIVVVSLLLVFQTVYEIASFIPGFEKKYFIKNFSDHRELMEKWVDKMIEVFDSEKETHDDLEFISLHPRLPSYKNNNGVFKLNCYLSDGASYTIEISATDDDYDALMDVQCDIPNPHGFFDDENSGGLAIFVTDKQVSFFKNRYAVVYSRSGWKPGYIRPTDRFEAYRVTRIGFHWYHVVGFDSKWLFFVA